MVPMKMPNFKLIGKQIVNGAKHYSPEILTGIGITGFLTATVLAVKVTPKAVKKLEKRKEELEVEKLPPVEVVKTVWKDYIPVVIPTVTGCACVIGAQVVQHKRNLGLAAALGMTEATLNTYKEKVIEEIGEKKETEIQDKIVQDELDKHPVSQGRYPIYQTGYGNQLFYDGVENGYFAHDLEVMRRQTSELNLDGFLCGGISLNEFRCAIGLKPIDPDIGDYLGWNERFDLDIHYGSADDGAPCGYLKWSIPPKWDYCKLH